VKKTDDAANERTPLKTAKVGGRQRLKPDRVPSFALRASYPHRYYARHEPTLEEYNTTTHSDSLNRFLFRMATRWSLIKSFLSLITVGGLFTILLAVLSTLLCYHYNFKASLPLAFLGTGIFFPISFGYKLCLSSCCFCFCCCCRHCTESEEVEVAQHSSYQRFICVICVRTHTLTQHR